jgi:hypothetical protein
VTATTALTPTSATHIPLAAHPDAFWWMFGIQLAVGVMLPVILRLWILL